jgi:hypothetical protein
LQDFEHLFKSYEFADLVDEIASADPPAYLRRCFAEGLSAPRLSFARVQQLAGCAVVLDAIVHGRNYDGLEPELIADWRAHDGASFAALLPAAGAALQRAGAQESVLADTAIAAELHELQHRLTGA